MIILDILEMELKKNLPYWLSPEGKRQQLIEAIRAKWRKRYLDAQKELTRLPSPD